MLYESQSATEYLKKEFERRTQSNARYSQRAFARHLGLSAGELSEIMRGVRPITDKVIFKVSRALGHSPVETSHLLHLLHLERGKKLGIDLDFDNTQPFRREDLSQEVFAIVADWYHFAIFNLMDIKGFRWNAQWIAKRLDLPVETIRQAMGRLMKVGLVIKQEGRFRQNKDLVLTTDGIPSEAGRKYHETMLEKAIIALNTESVDQRDILGVGLSCKNSDMPAIKKEIREFIEKLVSKYSGRENDMVVHLETALFRVSKEVKDA